MFHEHFNPIYWLTPHPMIPQFDPLTPNCCLHVCRQRGGGTRAPTDADGGPETGGRDAHGGVQTGTRADADVYKDEGK